MPEHNPEFTEDIKRHIGKMFNDIYFGNGEPAITVRLERGEGRMILIETKVNGVADDINKSRSFARGALIASIGSAIAVIGTLIADMVVKHWK
jgi:hypothetical protein